MYKEDWIRFFQQGGGMESFMTKQGSLAMYFGTWPISDICKHAIWTDATEALKTLYPDNVTGNWKRCCQCGRVEPGIIAVTKPNGGVVNGQEEGEEGDERTKHWFHRRRPKENA